MNIWIITIGEPLPTASNDKKLRSAILADKLLSKGHSVSFFASAFDHLKKKWTYTTDTSLKINDYFDLHILKGTGYKKNISLKRITDHRIISKKFLQKAVKLRKPDLIVVSMPPHDLAYHAVMFANKNNIPVVIDIRDPWPDIFLQAFPSFLSVFLRKILYRDFNYVKKAMQNADALLATTSTMLNWGLKYAARPKTTLDKVFFLGQKRTDPNEVTLHETEDIKNLKSKFIIFFVGTFSHYHSPLILLDVAKKLDSFKDIHFVIAGDGQLMAELRAKSKGLANVTLTGWLNDADIAAWLRISKVGVCITPKTIDILPNKTGTYLSAGLPIISAFQGDLKSLIEKEQIGFYYPPGDADELAACILKLYQDKSLYQKMSENARRVFTKLFDADKVYDEYANHIEEIANAKAAVNEPS